MELSLIQIQDNKIIKRYDTAVILHLYYPEMWKDILPYLLNLGKQFDLFMTIPYGVDIAEEIILDEFPEAQIFRCENRGRDVAPFLVVFSAIANLGYKYVCKIHTKKSPHIASGIEWQQDMLRKLLGSRRIISKIKKAFDEHPDWGLIAPQGHVTPFSYYWALNAKNVINLAQSVDIPTDPIEFEYVAGSMFWFRPQALDLLLKTDTHAKDFEPEPVRADGTLAHAYERFFGMVVKHSGFQIAESDSLGLRLSDIPLQFRVLIQEFQKLEKELDSQVGMKEQQVQVLIGQIAEKAQQVQALTAQVSEKDQLIQDSMVDAAEKEQSIAALKAQVAEIHSSTAWRLIQVLWKIRIAIVPHGSRRERWIHNAVHAVSFLKRNGVRSFTRRAKEKLKQESIPSLINPAPEPFLISLEDGKTCQIPAISIVIEKNSTLIFPPLNEIDVLAWVSSQTLQEIEVVEWESETGRAITLGEPVRSWDAPDLEKLCHGLAGRYLCMASPDLLQQNRAYLETNLIALETEGLVFTVNTLGKPEWLLDLLKSNHLPGDRMLPFLRQVLRKDCVRNDFTLNIARYPIEQPKMPTVAGKIIVHTTAIPDTDNPFSARTPLVGDFENSLKGNYILARSSSQIPWEPLAHVVHPVDTVMPDFLEPSNLPTIIIFMPFLAVGGAERMVLELIRYLQHQIRFIVVTLEGMDAALGTTADAFHKTVPFIYTAADYLLPPLNFSFLCYLIEHFQANTFYMANGSDLIYGKLSTLRQKYPGLRIIDQVYDHQIGWISRYDQSVVAAVDACISANPNISRAYIEHGVRPERIKFVEHAINLDNINPAEYSVERCIQIKQKLGIPVERKLVTFCARIHPQKRPLDFIELARRFAGEGDIHFLMVGDGPLSSVVEEQIERTGLKNFTRSKFYTPISDIYAITDVMVVPSEYEAMPLVVLETLAMGKPVVATDVGHIRDVVEMAHGGVVVPNIGDVAALRLGVLKALHEPVDSAGMRKVIEQRFGISHIAQQYLRVWLGDKHA